VADPGASARVGEARLRGQAGPARQRGYLGHAARAAGLGGGQRGRSRLLPRAIRAAAAQEDGGGGEKARPGGRGLETLVRHPVGSGVEGLGWEPQPGEDELDRQLRGDLLRALGTLGNDPETQERSRSLYARYREDETAVAPDGLPALIAIVAAAGADSEYEEFLQRFKSARTPQEEQRYLYALAGFRQPELIRRTLEKTTNGEVRSQDAPFLLRAVLVSVHSRGLAWEYIKANWETMARQYPGSAY